MRVIRAAGQNVSPADDGRLYSKAFADGLFEDVAISSLGTNLVSIGALYGIICGRDFTAEAQNITVILPETEGTTEGVIYVEIDISSDDVITIGSALKPFTPTYEDINMNGVVAQMVIAEYTATPVAVTDITSVYPVATAGGIGSMATIELSPVQNSYAVGDFLVWKGQLYKVTAAIASGETLVIGTNIEAVTIGTELTQLNAGLTQQWTEILASTAMNEGDTATIPNIENYKELYIRITIANRATTVMIPVPDIVSWGYNNEHQYIISCIATINITSGKIGYAVYAQVAFSNATTFQVAQVASNGYTGNKNFTICAR